MKRRLAADAEHQLGRAAADVDHEGWRPVGGIALAGRAQEREARLLVAAEHVRLEPVAVVHRRRELLAVGGVANRAGEHRHGPLGPFAVDRAPELVEGVQHAVDRLVAEPPVGVDPGAQAGDVAAALELGGHAAIVDVRDQQAGRVRADVDDGDASVVHRGGSLTARGPGGGYARGGCPAVSARLLRAGA